MAIEDGPESRLRYGEEPRARREGTGLTQEELSVRAWWVGQFRRSTGHTQV